jgi:hypothetical protein
MLKPFLYYPTEAKFFIQISIEFLTKESVHRCKKSFVFIKLIQSRKWTEWNSERYLETHNIFLNKTSKLQLFSKTNSKKKENITVNNCHGEKRKLY